MKKSSLRLATAALAIPAVVLLVNGAVAASSAINVVIPPIEKVFEGLEKNHPRLLLTPQRIEQIKSRLDTGDEPFASWHKKLRSDAQAILKAPPSRYEIPDGLRLLSTSRRVLQRVETLGLLYLVETNQACLDRAWKELDAAASFTNWNPRHFLDTAEMTRAFAEGYDWLYHGWSTAQRKILADAIVKHGFQPALEVYRTKRWWVRARHNWNQVCNGGMGMGALALGDVAQGLSAEILHGALESLPLAMAEFGPDGAWNEGPGYWSYATAYNVAFLDGLQTALNTDFGLSEIPGFSKTGFFPLYITGPIDRTFNYADGSDKGVHAPQISWFACKFDQPALSWYQRQTPSPSAMDLVWYCEKAESPADARLPLDRFFREAEVVTFRSSWNDKRACFVGFKAGDNKANHSHLDLGSFVFDKEGVRWATDMGTENYNLPGYFGGQRWTYYRLRAEGNNTVVINPGQQPDQDPSASTKIIRFRSTPEKAVAVADLTAAYRKHGVHKVWRGIALLNRDKLMVQDEIQTVEPAEVWWFMHTAARVEVLGSADRAVLTENGRSMNVRILSPAGAKFEVLPAAPLKTSPNPSGQNPNDNIRKLRVHLSEVKDASLIILFSSDSPGNVVTQPLELW